jgi:hypothetical protein
MGTKHFYPEIFVKIFIPKKYLPLVLFVLYDFGCLHTYMDG